MLLLVASCLLLPPLVAAAAAAAAAVPGVEPPLSSDVILDVDDGMFLRNIRVVRQPDGAQLNLSGMRLRGVDKSAFDNVPGAVSLDLSNNSLTSLPDFVFSNLTRLRSLSLSDNEISSLRNLFIGLESLRLLDISRNPILHLRRGDLFGLTRAVRILTDGNALWSISADVTANSFLKREQPDRPPMDRPSPAEESEQAAIGNTERQERTTTSGTLDKDVRVKLCRSDGVVTSLAILREDEQRLAEGCARVPVDAAERRVSLGEQGIVGFQEGWYQLRSLPIASLDLSHNEIAEIREETLNELPAGLTDVSFLGNRIRRIWRDVIDNEHLRALNFKNNLVEEIEEGALAKTRLEGLFLVGNRLESLDFVATLPAALTSLVLSGNRVTSIPVGAFDRHARLLYLNLEGNKIATLPNGAFRNLTSLQALALTKNAVTTIEPAAFAGLTALRRLDLQSNSIRDPRDGTFAGLAALRELNLSSNKIARAAALAELPRNVDRLHLDDNEIDALERGSFVRGPRLFLSIAGNRISRIERGAFNLTTLRDLRLDENALTSIDGDSYEGLDQLKRLSLSGNRISEIRKGSCKNFGALYTLDISRNPFRQLENGALYGLSTATWSSLYIYENNLKEMQAGLFDDV